MTKENIMIEVTNFMKDLTAKERGQFVSDIMQISLQLTLNETLSPSVKNVMNKTKEEVQ